MSFTWAGFSIAKGHCIVLRGLSQASTLLVPCGVRCWLSQLKLFIGFSQRPCAWLDFANAKYWVKSNNCMLRRLVSQVKSFPPNIQLYWAWMDFAHEHFTSEKSQLPIVLMTFEGKHFSMARVIARVSCIARRGVSQIVNGHMRWRLDVGKQA